ncbi:hypothetical protein JCM3775_002891 [Rhodotorula graminis]
MAQPTTTGSPLRVPTTTAPNPVDDLAALAHLSLNTHPASTSHPLASAPASLPPLPPLPAPSLSPAPAPPPLTAPSSSSSSSPPPPPSTATPRPFVLFHPACAHHRYARNTDIGTIVERPERLRAVKTGVAAAWARLDGARAGGGVGAQGGGGPAGTTGGAASARERAHEGGAEGLDALLEGLSLGGGAESAPPRATATTSALEVVGGPFDILSTTATMRVDDPALRIVHPVPNRAPGDDGADGNDGWSTASSTPPAPPRPPPGDPSTSASPSSSRPPSSAPLPWPAQLQHLCRTSPTSLLVPPLFSEIPPHLPQGDLYLCPGSEGAIFGALGAACEGVDRVVRGGAAGEGRRGFVAVRPPGHHCGESNPQGFCFVNNVAVAAAHAHIKHGINRVIILDIDLHHGNGTQEIVWRLNADAQRVVAEHDERALAAASAARASPRKGSPRKAAAAAAAAAAARKGAEEGREGRAREGEKEGKEEEKVKVEEKLRPRSLQVMYGSVHDIWSYPCEDGDPSLVAAASLSLSGAHHQHISNVHLDAFSSEHQFHDELYPRYWDALGGRADEFCERTGAVGDETLVIVSAGFDASQHESAGMSRHGRNVPTSFYRRFARDAALLAERRAGGKVLGVLEGGYSDWALASGVGAFLCGLVGGEEGGEGRGGSERDAWWAEGNLKKLDKACSVVKPRRGAPASSSSGVASAAAKHTLVGASPADAASDPWLARAVDIFTRIDEHATLAPPAPPAPRPSSISTSTVPRQLRERKVRRNYAGLDDGSTPIPSPERERERVPAAAARRGAPSSAAAAALAPPVPFVPSVQATTMAASAAQVEGEGVGEDGQSAAGQGRPSVRFTWKQGGFGGEPRA